MTATAALAKYTKDKGIKTAHIIKCTGIPRSTVYAAFAGRAELRASDFLKICRFIEVDPFDFYNQSA